MNDLIELSDTCVQSLVERVLLHLNRALNLLQASAEFMEYSPHLVGKHIYQLVKERFMEPKSAPIPYRAAQNAAEHIVAIRVARLNAICNREAERANVVGDYAEGDVGLNLR